MILTPTTAVPGASITAKGRAAKKRKTRIRIDDELVLGFTTGGNGQYARTIVVPSRPNGTYEVTVEQLTDAWRQVDHAETPLTIKNPIVTPEPVPLPPPPPPPEPEPEPVPPPPPVGTDVPIGKFQATIAAAVSGQTLLLAPGTHDIPGATYLFASGVTIAAKAPTPTIRPATRPNGLFVKGSRNTVRGLSFVGAPSSPGQYNDSNGSALFEVLGNDGPVVDTVAEDLSFDMPAGAGSRQHAVYLAYDIRRLRMSRINLNGRASQGGQSDGLTGYHDGTAPLEDIVLEDWVFTDFFNAVVFWIKCKSLTFLRCRSEGTKNVDLQLRTYGTVYVKDCSFPKGKIVDPGTTLVDLGGNRWAA